MSGQGEGEVVGLQRLLRSLPRRPEARPLATQLHNSVVGAVRVGAEAHSQAVGIAAAAAVAAGGGTEELAGRFGSGRLGRTVRPGPGCDTWSSRPLVIQRAWGSLSLSSTANCQVCQDEEIEMQVCDGT